MKNGFESGVWKRKQKLESVEAEALWRKKLKAEANLEAFDFLRNRKRKHFS